MADAAVHDDATWNPRRQRLYVALVALVAAPGVVIGMIEHTGGHGPAEWVAAIVLGLAIVAAAFALSWAAEVAQLDVSRGLALAVLAFIAVLPEYAVDLVFAWKAGKDPDEFAHLALANMTGANRLLIGVGWSLVVLLAVVAIRRATADRLDHAPFWDGRVVLDRTQAVEVTFLTIACVYSLTLPLKRTLTLFDTLVLVAIFVGYLVRISGAPAEEPHLVGPARMFGALPRTARRLSVVVLFVVSAGAILAVAEPFAENLVATGSEFGIDEFLLVQWLAPLASEAPELLVASIFAWRLNAKAGLGTLVSSKVNQWTLLVGTLPLVFAASAGAMHGLPIDSVQREELLLTAAQSVFAVAVLANLTLNVREALALLSLFLVQFVLGGVFGDDIDNYTRLTVSGVYLVLAAWLMIRDRRMVPGLLRRGLRSNLKQLSSEESDDLSGELHLDSTA